MRTQSPDTSLEAERYLIELIRQAPYSKRFRLVQALSQRMLSGQDPEQEARSEAIHVITCGYGRRIGHRVQTALNDAEWNDLLGILKVQGTALDLAQLMYWSQVLDAGHLLPLALSDAGLSPSEETIPYPLAG